MLTPDERSVWDDYLDLATPPNTPIAGQVCISKDIGYTVNQLAIILKTDPTIIERADGRLSDMGMITVANSGVRIVNNWGRYQSEYDRQKGYRQRLQGIVTPKGDGKDRKVATISTSISILKDIFNYWNDKKIMVHKNVENHKMAIDKAIRIKGYEPDEIKGAIRNYTVILKGEQYRWTYRWTLTEFLNRGLERFMNGDIAKANFLKDDYKDETDDQRLIKEQLRRHKE
jgi:hypothetical protein